MSSGGNKYTPPVRPFWWGFLADLSWTAASGVLVRLVGAPFERAKFLLQGQLYLHDAGRLDQQLSGTWNALKYIIENEGFASFYHGVQWAIFRNTPSTVISWIAKAPMAALIDLNKQRDPVWMSLLKDFISGTVIGAIGLIYVYPLDVCYSVVSTDVIRGRQYASALQVWSWAKYFTFPSPLFAGLITSIGGIGMYRSWYLSLAEVAKAVGKYNYFWMQIAVTLFSTFVTQPLDTIRRLQMLYAMDPRFIGQSGFMDVTKHIYATFGITGFFAGAGAGTIRGLLAALTNTLFEERIWKRFFNNSKR